MPIAHCIPGIGSIAASKMLTIAPLWLAFVDLALDPDPWRTARGI
jgi:hypothetical protein